MNNFNYIDEIPDYIETTTPVEDEEKELERLHDFYSVEIDYQKGAIKDIKLDRLKIINKLRDLGFFRYDMPDGSFRFVRIKDSKITLTNETSIIDAFEDYIIDLPPKKIKFSIKDGESETTVTGKMIQNVLYRNINTYFNNTIERLRSKEEIKIVQDTKTQKYFYFRNTAVEVSNTGIVPVDYSKLEGNIWSSSIIDRDFRYTETKGDFETFCEDICSNDPERKKSLMSMLGYLMHDFYEYNLKAILFTDVNKGDAALDAGRTGKGLIGKALDQMLNSKRSDTKYCSIPAKGLELDKDTRYSLADMSTQLIHLEDVDRRFNFEMLYNDITDGATIRERFQRKPIIKFVKMMISINKTIEISGSSTKGRLAIFELANFYSDSYTPEHKFGHRFFESDWTDQDWNNFYSFMCRCSYMFMKHGIIQAKEINFSNRRLQETLPETFLMWFNELLEPYVKHHEQHEWGKQFLFNEFIERYPDFNNNKFRQATLSKWCNTYCSLKSIPCCSYRSSADMFVIYPDEATSKKAYEQKNKLND